MKWLYLFIIFFGVINHSQLSFACTGSVAQCFLGYEIPPLNQVLKKTIPQQISSTLPDRMLKVVGWNIYKGDRPGWDLDLARFSLRSDIVLIQEAVWSDSMKKRLSQGPFGLKAWNYASSFVQNKSLRSTGVMTGAATTSLRTTFIRSPDVEPITETPKMTLFTRYPLSDGRELLVINVHGINFNPEFLSSLQRQMQLIEMVISRHDGPALLAGDFNTWISERTNIVTEMARRNGFFEVQVPSDSRNLVLDHIFVRNLLPVFVKLHTEIESSDHYPLEAQFRY